MISGSLNNLENKIIEPPNSFNSNNSSICIYNNNNNSNNNSNNNNKNNNNNNDSSKQLDNSINSSINSDDDDDDDNRNKAVLDNNKIDFYVGFLMVSLTTSLLFPYSSILSSLDYFGEIYPNYYTASTLPFVYMFTIASTYLLVLKVHHKTKHHYNILIGFIIYILVLITIPFINLSSIKGTLGSYILTVVLICSTAFVDSFIQSSIMSIAALFGSHYSIFCQIGFGLSGIISSIVRIIVKFSFKDKEDSNRIGIIIFYSVSCFVIFVASLVFSIMLKSHIGKYIMKKDSHSSTDNSNNKTIDSSNNKIIDSSNNKQLDSSNRDQTNQISNSAIQSPLKYVIFKNLHYNLILISLFTITMVIYPSFIYKVEFKDIKKDIYMVSVTAVFSLFDFIGRIVPLFLTKNIKYKHSIIWVFTLARSVFIVLFFIQIYIISSRSKTLVYILLVIFGFSDGFLSSICVSEPPKQVPREYKELSGIVTSFCANIGLLLGSSLNVLIMLLLFNN